MQINRYLSLNPNQFLGCASAFVDSLTGELNSAVIYLRRLDGRMKGSAFAYEMQLDKHRYGSQIVLERWVELSRAFRGHVDLGEYQHMFDDAESRVAASSKLLEKVNQVIDDAQVYSSDIVDVAQMAYGAVETTFQEERKAVDKMNSLGPMIPEDFKEYRRVYLADLAAR